MTEPAKIVTLVRDLFDKEASPAAALTATQHLEAHPEDLAAFLYTVSLFGREVVGFAEDHSSRSVRGILDFLPIPPQS